MNNKYFAIFAALEILCLQSVPKKLVAQTQNENYIMTETMLDASGKRSIKTVQYYDGLGRPSVLAAGGVNTSGKYVYSMTEYDMMGRESRKWLPSVGGASPDIISADDIAGLSNTTYRDGCAYSVTSYDALDRPLSVTTPGDLWNGKSNNVEYITNDSENNKVKKYIITSPSNGFKQDGFYAPCSLTGERTIDEDGHTLEVYKDLLGNVVLERRNDGKNGNNDTYFVYDRGLLRVVIPAGGGTYKYRYDGHGRCIEKTLPQCLPIKYWYDKYGRLAFMQDGRMRSAKKYRFFLYDGLSRMVVQGMCTEGAGTIDSTYAAKVVYGSGGKNIGNTQYFTESNYILTSPSIEIANYYDGYDCLTSNTFKSAVSKFGLKGNNTCVTTLLTAQIVTDNNGTRYYRVMNYDDKGRCIEAQSTSVDDYYIRTSTSYSFTDKITKTVTNTYRAPSRVSLCQVVDSLEYDSLSDLPVKELLKYGGESFEEIASYTYDYLGRVIESKSNNGKIVDTYKYDVHGWLTSHENYDYRIHYAPFFKENLYYADGPNSEPCYNGNISAQVYTDANNQYGTNTYLYKYDKMDRLLSADYSTYNSPKSEANYSERFEYNPNSSMKTLVRHGKHYTGGNTPIDSLQFRYNGVRLEGINDRAGGNYIQCSSDFIDGVDDHYEYEYDECGAIKMDANKGVYNIRYDYNGNPIDVLFNNGNVTEYLYTADGVKLRTIHRTVVNDRSMGTPSLGWSEHNTLSLNTTWYIGALELEDDASLSGKYYFANGYVDLSGSSPQSYNYMVKDHLGNVRHVDRAGLDNRGNEIVQVSNYYSYGGVHTDVDNGVDVQNHLYNGKELDRMHGLNLYDYSARQYDAAIGQFTSMDPLCEKYYHISPYAYCAGNPVNAVDPDGREWFYYSKDGRSDPTWNWRDEHEYHTGVFTESGDEVILQGREAVVEFNGFYDEHLDENSKMTLNESSKLADITVYGPNGADDIGHYKGLTMSSNPTRWGVVDNGEYSLDKIGSSDRKGPYGSVFAVNNRGKVHDWGNLNPNPNIRGFRDYLEGVFVHRSNWDGWAGEFTNKDGRFHAVSEGCLLVHPQHWNSFEKQLMPIKRNALLIVKRR